MSEYARHGLLATGYSATSADPAERAEIVRTYLEAGPEKLAQLRATGQDPVHGGEAAKKRGQSNAKHQQVMLEWGSTGQEQEPIDFANDILPKLHAIPLSAIMEATGLSLRYCSLIRRGLHMPHVRHYPALRRLIDTQARRLL